MCHGFQEITWYTTFFNSHARKMEKKALGKKEKVYSFSKPTLCFMCSLPEEQKTKCSNQQKIQQLKRSDSWGSTRFYRWAFSFVFSISSNYADDNNLFTTGTDI